MACICLTFTGICQSFSNGFIASLLKCLDVFKWIFVFEVDEPNNHNSHLLTVKCMTFTLAILHRHFRHSSKFGCKSCRKNCIESGDEIHKFSYLNSKLQIFTFSVIEENYSIANHVIAIYS